MLTYEVVSDGIDENISAYERVGDGIDENSNLTSDDSNNNPTCSQYACPLKGLLKNTSNSPMTSSSSGDDVRHKRKSVSFFDDVIVYIFDQDSPTRELQCHWSDPNGQTDNRSSVANRESSCPRLSYLALTDSSSDVNGLEWEDDFSAFDTLDSSVTETNCQQWIPTDYTGWNNQSQPQGQQVLRSPQRWSTLSRLQSFTLSPSCLILTHVTESDLREF